MRSTALPCGLSRGWIRVSASGVGAHFGLRGVTSGSQCIQGDMTPHQVSTGSSLLSVLVIRGRSCRIGGSIRARGGSVIPLPLITTGGVRTVARCRSRTTSYVGRQYRQAAVLDSTMARRRVMVLSRGQRSFCIMRRVTLLGV